MKCLIIAYMLVCGSIDWTGIDKALDEAIVETEKELCDKGYVYFCKEESKRSYDE